MVLVPTNIVEGCARTSRKEFLQFLSIANGSIVEVEYLLFLSSELGFLKKGKYSEVEDQRRKVAVYLYKFTKSVRSQLIQ